MIKVIGVIDRKFLNCFFLYITAKYLSNQLNTNAEKTLWWF